MSSAARRPPSSRRAGPARRRGGRAPGAGAQARRGAVPRRDPARRRMVARRGVRHRARHHRVLRVALAPGLAGARRPGARSAARWRRTTASQFLNLTLPGGVAGDVHRAVRHGRDVGDVGRSARAVAWERTAGQIVQVVLTVALLLVLPSPVHAAVPWIALGLVVGALVLVLVGRALPAQRRVALVAHGPRRRLRRPARSARAARVARHRRRVGGRRRRPDRHAARRGARRRRHPGLRRAPAAGAADPRRDGAPAEHRRVGTARGRGGVGVRRRGSRREPRRHDGRGLRRARPRREPAGRRRAARRGPAAARSTRSST